MHATKKLSTSLKDTNRVSCSVETSDCKPGNVNSLRGRGCETRAPVHQWPVC